MLGFGLILTIGTGLFVASEFSMVNLERSDLEARRERGERAAELFLSLEGQHSLVVVEHDRGALADASREAMTAARSLAASIGLPVAALTIGASPPMDWNRVVTPTPQQSHVIGNPAAKVKLTTWVSYTCPHCAEFERESDAALKLKYIRSGKVSVEIRHLVRDPIDLTVAMLTNCGPKDKFPLNHSAFMRSQPTWIGILARSSKTQQARWTSGALPVRARAIASDFGFYQIMASRGYDRVSVDRCLADVGMAQRLERGNHAFQPGALLNEDGFDTRGEDHRQGQRILGRQIPVDNPDHGADHLVIGGFLFHHALQPRGDAFIRTHARPGTGG